MLKVEEMWNRYFDELETDEKRKREHFYVTDTGRCLRGVYLERQGAERDEPLDDRTKRVFHVGNVFEDEVVKVVSKHHEIETQGQILFDEYDTHGRYDLLIKGDEPHLIELKTMHSNGFWWREKSGFQPLDHHLEQISLYLYKLKETMPNLTASIVYISKDDLCMKQIPVELNMAVVGKALTKLQTLKEAWDKQLPPALQDDFVFDEVKKKWEVSWQAKYCPFHKQCTGDPDWLVHANTKVKELNKK